MIVTIILLTALLAIIMLLLQPSTVIHIKQLLLPILCMLFVACLILMSGTVLEAAMNGLALWVNAIVPALFPFYVAVEILNATGFVRSFDKLLDPIMRPLFNVPGSASFALIMGIISGYPIGAKIAADLRSTGVISKAESERLLAFTNNSGPLFIIGAVGTTIYASSAIGLLLFACHVLACISVGLLFRYVFGGRFSQRGRFSQIGKQLTQKELQEFQIKNPRSLRRQYSRNASIERTVPSGVPLRATLGRTVPGERTVPFGTMLGAAVKNSVTAILTIGGFVVLFSVIIQILTDIGVISIFAEMTSPVLSPFGFSKEITKGILSGLLEVTTGSSIIGYASAAPLHVKLTAASFIIGWAGLSVHSQVTSIVSKTDISIRPYLIGKFMQGIFASAYTWVALKIFYVTFLLEGTLLSEETVFPKDRFFEPNTLYPLTNAIAGDPLQILVMSILLMLATLVLFMIILIAAKRNRVAKGKA